jgi:hypothetical protein
MAIGHGISNGRGHPGTNNQPSGTALSKAFLWSMYPSLEAISHENMQEYYEMSTSRCMTKAQLDFNNKLVKLIKDEPALHGWVWGEGYGTDKQIQNRIRCYYKVSCLRTTMVNLNTYNTMSNCLSLLRSLFLLPVPHPKCQKETHDIAPKPEETITH